MKVGGVSTRAITVAPSGRGVEVLDQTALPHAHRRLVLATVDDCARAITAMQVRGAPLIGVTAAYGVALALASNADDRSFAAAVETLGKTRPTAVNLRWALERMTRVLAAVPLEARAEMAWREANAIAEEDVAQCRAIGEHGLALFRPIAARRGRLAILTHCNAGWLATVDHGTALSPVYAAFDAGLDVHVWVSETRPRSQGLLTRWELAAHGVPHTFVSDNAAGHLLVQGAIDAVIVGADRVARNGDVANKVGTYLKALAAREAGVPFFVAFPRGTVDFAAANGAAIPIEERGGDEVRLVSGLDEQGEVRTVRILPEETPVANPAFDVTPSRLVTSFVTESGVCAASEDGLRSLYPEASVDAR